MMIMASDKLDSLPEEQYTVGQIVNDLDPSDDSTPPPAIAMKRNFPDNPFLNRAARAQFVCDKHDAILKQFSSSQFRLPSVHHVMSPSTKQLVDHISDNPDSRNGDRRSTDLEDTGPLVFEFPYYLNATKRNLVLMKEHFMQEDRVGALKIAIQTARFLIDHLVLSEPQFYPAIYVLVSKVLDEFGQLIYDRLHLLAVSPSLVHLSQNQHNFEPQTEETDNEDSNYNPKHQEQVSSGSICDVDPFNPFDDEKEEKLETLPSNFRSSHCSQLCQSKCSNWFYKISAIRELVPRILIEISLFRSLRFLYPLQQWLQYAELLQQRLRGISDPLVAGYVRLFCAEQMFVAFGTASFQFGAELIDSLSIYSNILHDVLFTFRAMSKSKFQYIECVFYGQLESGEYLNLFDPVLDTLFGILEYGEVFETKADLKMYLERQIAPNLLVMIDLSKFLNIKSKRTDPYVLKLDQAANIYNKYRSDSGPTAKRRQRKSEPATIAAFVDMLEESSDREDSRRRQGTESVVSELVE